MRKILSAFLIVITVTLLSPQKAQAELPAKAKAFLTIVGYGTAGGAILGAATMAFGQSTRAVAQGASLGLYAGILFGTYVLVSHAQGRQGSYDDNSIYKDSSDIYGEEYNSENGGGEGEEKSRQGFFNRIEMANQKFGVKTKGGNIPPLTINLLQLEF